MLSAAVLINSQSFIWLKTWEPGALYELWLKAVENLKLSLKGWRWLWEQVAGSRGCGSAVGFAAGQDVVLCWLYLCSSNQHARGSDTGSVSLTHRHLAVTRLFFAQCCSGSLTDVAELLKRTKEVLVKIKCFLPLVSSPWKWYVCMVRVCI